MKVFPIAGIILKIVLKKVQYDNNYGVTAIFFIFAPF